MHSTSNRATKFRHVVPDVLELDAAETAVLSVLMLRGAQTVGELKGRTERQHRFDSIDEVGAVLAALAGRDDPLVRQLERQPGQKDARWVHLLAPFDRRSAVAASATGAVRRQPTPPIARRDAYGEATAEFYDLLATDMWDTLRAAAARPARRRRSRRRPDHRRRQRQRDRPAPTCAPPSPGAEVFAIEPSKAMRVALHARLTEFPELREQHDRGPQPIFGEARLPKQASAMVLSAVYRPPVRRRARAAVAVHRRADAGRRAGRDRRAAARSPARLRPSSSTRELPVGDYVYEGWQSGTPIDERRMSVDADLQGRRRRRPAPRSPSTRRRRRGGATRVDDIRAEIAAVRADADRARGLRGRAPAERLTMRAGAARRARPCRVVVDGETVDGRRDRARAVRAGRRHARRHAANWPTRMADKIWNLRVLDDADGRDEPLARRSSPRDGEPAEVLVVSQFTLYGNTDKGRRPSWIDAARPEHAEPLVDAVVARLRALGCTVATGRFRTEMKVELVNDGPVTLMLEV